MMLLAQLNLEEIPNIEHMPQHGMLQFFISAEEDLLEQILIIQQSKKTFELFIILQSQRI